VVFYWVVLRILTANALLHIAVLQLSQSRGWSRRNVPAGCHAYACVSMRCPVAGACPRERGHGARNPQFQDNRCNSISCRMHVSSITLHICTSSPTARDFRWSLGVALAVSHSPVTMPSRSGPRLVEITVMPPVVRVWLIVATIEWRWIYVRRIGLAVVPVRRAILPGRRDRPGQGWIVPWRLKQWRIVHAIPAVQRKEAGGIRRNRPQVVVHVEAVETGSPDPMPDRRGIGMPGLAQDPRGHGRRKHQRKSQPRR
jgi:hypothetical protein